MSKPNTIQINIPTPCSQSWEEMASTGDGRFCTHCQKTVIDFTAYSDTALYNFFAKNNEHVCGRFLNTQISKPLHIPHQPQSRLYRLTIALGLTLLFTQTPALLAQTRPPIAAQTEKEYKIKSSDPFGLIKGNIVDQAAQPLPDVVVQVYRDGNYKAGTMTGANGNFSIPPLDPGTYTVVFSHPGNDTITDINITVTAGQINMLYHRLNPAGTLVMSLTTEPPTVDIRTPQVVTTGTAVAYFNDDPLNYCVTVPTAYKKHKHHRKAVVKSKTAKKLSPKK